MRILLASAALTVLSGFAAHAVEGSAPEPMAQPAESRQSASGAYSEVGEVRIIDRFGLTTEQLEGADIRSQSGERIGRIDETLQNPQGEITAVAAEVGGYLGIGEKEVVIPLYRITREGVQGTLFIVDLTSEEIKQLPEWDD